MSNYKLPLQAPNIVTWFDLAWTCSKNVHILFKAFWWTLDLLNYNNKLPYQFLTRFSVHFYNLFSWDGHMLVHYIWLNFHIQCMYEYVYYKTEAYKIYNTLLHYGHPWHPTFQHFHEYVSIIIPFHIIVLSFKKVLMLCTSNVW
jgi:hypothetical protein